MLGYLDQNLTSVIVNRPSNGLEKPPGHFGLQFRVWDGRGLDLEVSGIGIAVFQGLILNCSAGYHFMESLGLGTLRFV